MKAILVVDMPKSCEDCPCTDYMFCYATQKELEIDWEVNKPSWCPLKPMPMRSVWKGDFSDGWNACIEEIEK